MKYIWAAIILTSLSSATSAETAFKPGPVIDMRPVVESVGQYYPKKAFKDKVSGRVKFNCSWTDTGRLTDCLVLEETPEGYGFGAATVQLLEDKARIDLERTKALLDVSEKASGTLRWEY